MNPSTVKFISLVAFLFSVFTVDLNGDTELSDKPTLEELEDLRSIHGKIKGQIVFQRRLGALWSIWKMNADGTELKMLSNGKSDDQSPTWSQDGKKIYFISNRSGHWQIYSMNEKGKNIENLSRTDKKEYLCNLNADNTRMLFQTEEEGPMKAFIRDLPTGKVFEIDFFEFPGRGGKVFPTLSPDGKKLAFLFKSGEGAGRAVYVGDLDSSYKLGNIVKIHLGCFSAWSKDSFRFLMCIFVRGGTALHVVTADGKEKNAVSEGGRWNYFPSWSPDEEWIVWAASPTEYHDYNSGHYDIYIASLKDRKPIRLTFNAAADTSPSWRP